MAINKIILKKIDDLKIDKDEKQLLIDLLNYQERGAWQYKKQYEEIVSKYLEKKSQ